MTMQPYQAAKGGSIDYVHYAQKAHEIRSQSFLGAMHAIAAMFSKTPASGAHAAIASGTATTAGSDKAREAEPRVLASGSALGAPADLPLIASRA